MTMLINELLMENKQLRDKVNYLEDKIKKDTFVLIVKSHDDVSAKTKYAEEHGIPILEPIEFKAQFM